MLLRTALNGTGVESKVFKGYGATFGYWHTYFSEIDRFSSSFHMGGLIIALSLANRNDYLRTD